MIGNSHQTLFTCTLSVIHCRFAMISQLIQEAITKCTIWIPNCRINMYKVHFHRSNDSIMWYWMFIVFLMKRNNHKTYYINFKKVKDNSTYTLSTSLIIIVYMQVQPIVGDFTTTAESLEQSQRLAQLYIHTISNHRRGWAGVSHVLQKCQV